MRTHAAVSPLFWTRGTGKRLRGNKSAQILAMYLMSAPSANMIGLFHLAIPTICHETGLTNKEVVAAFQVLGNEDFAHYDDEEELVWLPSGARTQIGESMSRRDKRFSQVERLVSSANGHRFALDFLRRYGEPFSIGNFDCDVEAGRCIEGASSQQEGASVRHGCPPDPDPDPVPASESSQGSEKLTLPDTSLKNCDRFCVTQTELFEQPNPEPVSAPQAAPKPKGRPRGPRKVKDAPDGSQDAAIATAHKTVVDHYFSEYERLRGVKPPFGGADGKAIKRLLDGVRGDADVACKAITGALTDPYRGPRETIRTISCDPAKWLGPARIPGSSGAPPKTQKQSNGGYSFEDRRI